MKRSISFRCLADSQATQLCQSILSFSGTFTLSNLGMFGVDRFDAILPPGTGAIMAVGTSQPSVVASKDGRIGMKSQMQSAEVIWDYTPFEARLHWRKHLKRKPILREFCSVDLTKKGNHDLTLSSHWKRTRPKTWASDDQLTLPESTPECLSRSLKVVEINDYVGYGSPLRLAEYILTYAAVLKVMRIHTVQDDSDSEMDGLVQLFKVRRASRHFFDAWPTLKQLSRVHQF